VARGSLPAAAVPSADIYVPHRPHDTVLYGLVREHLATFLAYAARTYVAPLPRYVAWAVLMKRTWALDVLACPRCSRKLRVLATITQPDVIRKILEHLGVRSSPLPRAPARDPDGEQTDLGFDADAA